MHIGAGGQAAAEGAGCIEPGTVPPGRTVLGGSVPRIALRLPDLTPRAHILQPVGPVPATGPAIDGDAAELRRATIDPEEDRSRENPPYRPAPELAGETAARLLGSFVRGSLRTRLAAAGAAGNLYLLIQQPKLWLAAITALIVQVAAALIFGSGPTEVSTNRPAGWTARHLPPAARPPEVPAESRFGTDQTDDVTCRYSPARSLPDGALLGKARHQAPLETDARDPGIRLADRPHVWPSLRRPAEPGVARMSGEIELLHNALPRTGSAREGRP